MIHTIDSYYVGLNSDKNKFSLYGSNQSDNITKWKLFHTQLQSSNK